MSLLKVSDVIPVAKCFLGIGIDLQAPNVSKIFTNPYLFCLSYMCQLSWLIAMISYEIVNLSDFERVVKGLAGTVQVSLMVFKVGTFVFKRKEFVRLIKHLEVLALEGDSQERAAWNKEAERVNTIGWAYLIVAGSTAILCGFIPIGTFLYHLIKNGTMVITIPLLAYFPFDTTTPFNGFFTNIWGWLLIYTGICALVGMDNIFFWYVYNVTAHLSIIRLKIVKLSKQLAVENESAAFQREFTALIAYHRQVITMSNQLDAVFNQIILIEVTLSCLQICFLTYQVFFGSEVSDIFFYFMLSMTVVLQVTIYCFGGQKIQDGHSVICDDLYLLFPWHRMSPQTKRLFLLPLMRTQRPLMLTGYFFIVNRALLVWIFRTAGSFTALLFAMKDKY